jgi:hypothetical protein
LLLEDEEDVELDPEAAVEAREFQQKFSRRQLGSNVDRYTEPGPVLNSDGTCDGVFSSTSFIFVLQVRKK